MNLYRPPEAMRVSADSDAILAHDVDGDGLDLRAQLATLWRGRWIILVCTAVALVLALLAISQMRPSYRASATVLFEPQKANITDIRDVLAGPNFSPDTLMNEVQILSSSGLVGRVVDTLDLARYPELNPRLASGERSLLDRLVSLLDWRTYVSPETLADLGIISAPEPVASDPEAAARREELGVIAAVQSGLTLEPVRGSRVIEIAFEARQPVLAARVANAVAAQYIEDQLAAKLTATRRASEWLSDRVDELAERVRGAELAVERARAEVADESGQSSEVTRQQLSQISAALTAARAERARIKAQFDSVAAALEDEQTDLGAVTLFRDAGVIQRLRQQESDIRSRYAALTSFARDNPARTRLAAELEEIAASIRAEAARIVTALRNDLEVARARETSLEEEVKELEAVEEEQRRGEVALRQLEREAEASRVLYESFLGRLEETSQQESLQTANARILSPAEVPTSPVSTTKYLILAIALAVGGLLGVGLVFLLDRLNNTFRGVEQIESATGLPVLANLPAVGTNVERAAVVKQLHDRPNGLLAEAVRNLRTSILFSSVTSQPKVVLFTSATPREGKSTSALLMAMTSQQMGRSAIIVDCDLRLHSLSNLFGEADERPGLLSVLTGTATLEDAVRTDAETGLTVLTAQRGELAATTLNAADVVASEQFAGLIRRLAQSYDLVVLDTPPVLVVTDPRIIARLAESIVFVVKWDATPRGAVLEGLRELTSVNAPIAGLVLTMVDSDRVASYAYEGYGHYRSRYMDYYR